ncbi:hypothetical protein FNH22_27245 [Fulvivirga sp. M361]|uniref:hypothetical protein n=1 Tax=Fulvivirga sp. M361 TaxID=2594266 RepID=UPI001179B5AC|nr:hypothetical protein [Fulvivirga sp. M361]TRX49325.1 hypothetical protein FNH22_27245 [Fulvivirga sp. M361]
MKKLMILLFLGSMMIFHSVSAGSAIMRFQGMKGYNIQVIVDGKLMNKDPRSIVRIRGRSGQRNVKIKVYDRYGYARWTLHDQILAKAGFISNFEILYSRRTGTRLKKTGVGIMDIERFRRPERFYNKRYLTNTDKKINVPGKAKPVARWQFDTAA